MKVTNNCVNEHFEIVYKDKQTQNNVTVFIPTEAQALKFCSELKAFGYNVLSRQRVFESVTTTRTVSTSSF